MRSNKPPQQIHELIHEKIYNSVVSISFFRKQSKQQQQQTFTQYSFYHIYSQIDISLGCTITKTFKS